METVGAGRTDRGVHAWGQVVSLDLRPEVDLVALQRALLKLCGPQVVVREAMVADREFHAPLLGAVPHLSLHGAQPAGPRSLRRRHGWQVSDPLEWELLVLACDPFLGEHDFSAFCRRPKTGPGEEPVSLVRRVHRAEWSDLGEGMLRFEIEATAFCHQMVRSIVGTVVAAGHAGVRAGDIRGILRSGDRSATAPIAPPHGLCLWHVSY